MRFNFYNMTGAKKCMQNENKLNFMCKTIEI